MKNKKIKTTFGQKNLLIVLGIFILALFEFGLRVFHVNDRASQSDPFVGFENVYPLFGEKVDSDGKIVLTTNHNKLAFFNYQEFEKQKPASTYRIFCFGGSTTYGRPYRAETAFPNWLEIYLNLMDTTRQFEVINAGGISYASYRIVHLVEEAAKYQPDLFILYCGHNEFLEARTYEGILTENPALKTVRMLLDKMELYVLLRNSIVNTKQHLFKSIKTEMLLGNEVSTILDDVAGLDRYTRENLQQEKIVEHFQYNIEKIIEIAQRQNIKIVLSTLTSNLKDFSPFKSEHKHDLADEELVQWNEHYQQAQFFHSRNNFEEALAAYDKCLAIDNQFAELVYHIAQCKYQVEQFDLAKKYYQMAKELDICPLRAPKEINAVIQELSERFMVPLVDIEREFEKLSPYNIPDNGYLVDHVHPTVEGYQIIAQKIAATLQKSEIANSTRVIENNHLTTAYQDVLNKLPDDYYITSMLNLAKVLGWARKEEEKSLILNRYSKKLQGYYEYHFMLGINLVREGKLDEAIYQFKQAISRNPVFSESYTNLGFALNQSGSPDEALKNYRKALSLEPGDYVAQTNIASIYFIKGEYSKAIGEYKKAIEIKSDYSEAHEGLGVTYYKQGNNKRALEELNFAVELNPNYAEAYYNIGLIYLDQRKIDDAIANFTKAIDNDSQYADAYTSLGVCYYHKKMLAAAIDQLNIAIKIDPQSGKAHNNLAIAYHSAGKYDLAWKHLRTAQRLKYTVHPQFIEMLKQDTDKSK